MPDFGDGSAREEYGQVDPYAPSLANGQITPEQWAEYSRKRRRAAILGTLGTIAGMSFAQPAVNALGLGASAGGGAAASASGGAIPSFATEGIGFSAAPAIGAGGSAAAGAGAGAAAGGSGAAASGLFAGMSARDLAALGLTGAGMVGGAMSTPPNMQPNTQTTDPNLQKLIATMQGRLDQSEPLYKSIMAMANGLLPTQYQNGGAGR